MTLVGGAGDLAVTELDGESPPREELAVEADDDRPDDGAEEAGGPKEPAEEAAAAEPTEGQVGEAQAPTQPGVGAAGDQRSEEPQGGPKEPAEAAAAAEPTEGQVGEAQAPTQAGVEAAGDRRPGELQRYVLTAAVSAGVLLFALAFFMAGFWAHALLDEDDGGGGDGDGMPASASDDPAWGPEDAAVTIQEFGDFQCPACGWFARTTLPKVREAYEDRVRYVFRDFPLTSIHPSAQKAAEAAQCAHEQGLFWEYHDLLFAEQADLAVPALKMYAEQVEADTGEFNECLDSGKNAREVALDIQDGTQAGVDSTPTFLINGLRLSGAPGFEQLEAIIDQVLAGVGE